jgi:hypothetical protein
MYYCKRQEGIIVKFAHERAEACSGREDPSHLQPVPLWQTRLTRHRAFGSLSVRSKPFFIQGAKSDGRGLNLMSDNDSQRAASHAADTMIADYSEQ